MNNDTIMFLNALGYDKIAVRSFSDKHKRLKGISINEYGYIRCDCCGKYFSKDKVWISKRGDYVSCKECTPIKKEYTLQEFITKQKLFDWKNKHNQGVHIAVNGAHTDKEVTKVYAQFFEVDDKPLEEQWRIIQQLKIKPSIIVKTRKSFHVYFLIKDGNIKRFKEIQKRLALTFGGDMQKSNLSTCMRVPGFYHCKKDPIMVKLVECHPELIYTQDELVKGLQLRRYIEPERKRCYCGNYDNAEIVDMVIAHIGNNIFRETDDKIMMSCLVHDDRQPSAVFFKKTLFYFCSGCGVKMNIKELAENQGWTDILNYLQSKSA